jgi:protein-arginine kinase activator protein McsA
MRHSWDIQDIPRTSMGCAECLWDIQDISRTSIGCAECLWDIQDIHRTSMGYAECLSGIFKISYRYPMDILNIPGY